MRALRPLQPRWDDGVLHLAVRDDGRFTAGPANLQVAADELQYDGRTYARSAIQSIEVVYRSGEPRNARRRVQTSVRPHYLVRVHVKPSQGRSFEMRLPSSLPGAALELERVLEQWADDDGLSSAWGPNVAPMLVPSLEDEDVRRRLGAIGTVEGVQVPCSSPVEVRPVSRVGCAALLLDAVLGGGAWYASHEWILTGDRYQGELTRPWWFLAWLLPQLVVGTFLLWRFAASWSTAQSGRDGLSVTSTGLRLPVGTRLPWDRIRSVRATVDSVQVETPDGVHQLHGLEGRSGLLAAALEGLRRREVEEVPPELQRLAAAVARRTE